MGQCLDGIGERAASRRRWRVERSAHGEGRFRVCTTDDDVVAENLSETAADALAMRFNTVRDDAEALARHVLA